jgi:hypothetical protein
MRKARNWTEKDNERIKAFAAKGASVFRAAAALNRTIISVRDQARRLGTPFPKLRDIRKRLAESDGSVSRN